MSEFCETCPLKGECDGEIVGRRAVVVEPLERYYFQFTNEEGEASEIIYAGRTPGIDRYIKMIDRCPGPMTRKILAFSKVYCGSLGDSGVKNKGSIARKFQEIADEQEP